MLIKLNAKIWKMLFIKKDSNLMSVCLKLDRTKPCAIKKERTKIFREEAVITDDKRAQLMEEGSLINVSTAVKEFFGFKYLVALTDDVWLKYVQWHEADTKTQGRQDETERLKSILCMLHVGIRIDGEKRGDNVYFKLAVIPRDGQSGSPKIVTLRAILMGKRKGLPFIIVTDKI